MTCFRLGWVAPLVLAATLPCAAQAQNLFAAIEGVGGPCGVETRNLNLASQPRGFVTPRDSTWFSVVGFTGESSREVSLGGERPAPTKPNVAPFLIQKLVDACTPLLLQASTAGSKELTGTIISVRTSAQTQTVAFLVRFEAAFVTATSFTAAAGSSLAESVQINVGKISYSFVPLDSQGRSADPVCFGWDFTKAEVWPGGCQ